MVITIKKHQTYDVQLKQMRNKLIDEKEKMYNTKMSKEKSYENRCITIIDKLICQLDNILVRDHVHDDLIGSSLYYGG